MKHTDANWAIAVVVAVSLGWALGCSDSKPDGTGGGGGSGGAGATGGAGGGTGGAGGGTDGGGGADAGPTVEEACAHLAAVTCEKYSQCLPYFVPVNFGDVDTCVKQYVATQCRNRVGIDDSSETAAQVEACAAARATATCAQWFDNDVSVSACLPQPGTRPTGVACGTASQCQTTNCQIALDADCGTCGGTLVGAGAQCSSSSQCAGNMQCFGGACGLPRGLGEPCSSNSACQYAFMCVNGRCAVPARAGESCGTTPCSIRDGLNCANGVCEPWQFVGTGQQCFAGIGLFCSRAGFCRTTPPVASGTCISAAAAGEPCDNTIGPFCLPWSACVGGICKVLDFGMCK